MADLYVCPVEGRTSSDIEEFVNHAVVAHGHQVNRIDCRCDACVDNPKEEPS